MSDGTRQQIHSTERVALGGRLVPALVALTVVVVGAIVAVALDSAHRGVDSLRSSLVKGALDRTERAVQDFFKPVRRTLRTIEAWAARGDLADDGDALVRRFAPMLEHEPQVSSMTVAGSGGREFMLLQYDPAKAKVVDEDVTAVSGDASGWLVRRTTPESSRDARGEWWPQDLAAAADLPVKQVDYDSRSRPWHRGAVAAPGSVHWTKPYSFFTTRNPGITASITYPLVGTDEMGVIGLDVLLADISRFTSTLGVGANGRVIVIDEDKRVVGLPNLPRFEDPAECEAAYLLRVDGIGLPIFQDGLEAWRKDGAKPGAIVSFSSEGAAWWSAGRWIDIGGGTTLGVIVIVEEATLMVGYNDQRNVLVGLSILALLLAGAVGIVLSKRISRELDVAVKRARELGQYTLEKKIGSGAMGAVYRARHSMLLRPTAIKLLRPETEEKEGALARFEHEVKMTGRLSHPNTISVYDYGVTQDGVFYFAMEYLDGITLEGLVRATGQQPAARVIHILYQICGSLNEAHAAGMVHRDIKPANVMLCRSGGMHDVVKVLDFGLVRHRTEALEESRVENPKGTPLFMSPEAFMTPADVDARVDIYAVGAVGYYLLTGVPPFMEASVTLLFTKIVQEEPIPPSERTSQYVPKDLEMMIMACLRKRREDRPQEALQLAGMLERCKDFARWTRTDALDWWTEHEAELPIDANDSTENPDAPAGPLTREIERRSGSSPSH